MSRTPSHQRSIARRKQSRHGFSLIEVMVAMLVLGFGLLTMATAQIHAVKGAQSGRHRTRAVSLAQSQMEQLHSARWLSIAPTAWTVPAPRNTTIEAPANQIEQAYLLQWRITDVLPNRTRSLDVRVNWTEPSGRARTYTVTSTRFNYEGL